MKSSFSTLLLFMSIFVLHAQVIDIPDDRFKELLLEADVDNEIAKNLNGDFFKIDTNNDGEIQEDEALNVQYLLMINATIDRNSRAYQLESLVGIEYFTNLIYLNASRNSISSINLNNNTNLVYLYLFSNHLTSLDLDLLVNLEEVSFSGNNLTTINTSNNSNLKLLNCSYNSNISFDVSNNLMLEALSCAANELTTIDVSNNINLINLYCYHNQLTNVDISSNPNLTSFSCSINQLTSLDVSNNISLTSLELAYNDITSLDTYNNADLLYLNCSENLITNLSAFNNVNLIELNCSENELTNLNISNNTNLSHLDCSSNELISIDLSNNFRLSTINCSNNQFVDLDFTNNSELTKSRYNDNLQLTAIKQKNSAVLNYNSGYSFFDASNCPSLEYVCADDYEINDLQNYFNNNNMIVNVNSYCFFTPGGVYYTVEGETTIDIDNNGCDQANDFIYPNLKLNINDGVNSGAYIGNNTGGYIVSIQEGQYTITPELENPSYYNISPTSITVDFPTDTSPFIQNFCITPNEIVKDINITIIPLNAASPGFNSNYRIIYTNVGNTTIDFGQVTLTNDFDLMEEVSFSPNWDSFTTTDQTWHFNYENLLPFESRTIDFTFNINTPTDNIFPVNGGDILTFTANHFIEYDTVVPETAFVLEQTVVNSYDPNDKTCLEGNTLSPDKVGEYLNYMIRFENTGTANAINIVVKDEIDTSMFDVATLRKVASSHSMVTKITGNIVEFIFEDIDLPFDDANNDGYVVFKLKTLDSLVEGDIVENDAEIYFDYNFPINTNNEVTTVQNPLSVNDNIWNANEAVLYPNPVVTNMTIKSKNEFNSVSVYSINGRLYKHVNLLSNKKAMQLNLKDLSSGLYFVKIKSVSGESTIKFVKQ